MTVSVYKPCYPMGPVDEAFLRGLNGDCKEKMGYGPYVLQKLTDWVPGCPPVPNGSLLYISGVAAAGDVEIAGGRMFLWANYPGRTIKKSKKTGDLDNAILIDRVSKGLVVWGWYYVCDPLARPIYLYGGYDQDAKRHLDGIDALLIPVSTIDVNHFDDYVKVYAEGGKIQSLPAGAQIVGNGNAESSVKPLHGPPAGYDPLGDDDPLAKPAAKPSLFPGQVVPGIETDPLQLDLHSGSALFADRDIIRLTRESSERNVVLAGGKAVTGVRIQFIRNSDGQDLMAGRKPDYKRPLTLRRADGKTPGLAQGEVYTLHVWPIDKKGKKGSERVLRVEVQ